MKAMYPKRQQMHVGLGNALVSGVVSPSTTPRAGLPAPQQLAPPNGATFSNYPRTTTLSWTPVTNAASYSVELDCFQCCAANKWCTAVGRTWQVVTDIVATQYVFNWVGAQPGRWRVWAVRRNGRTGYKTRWSKFTYTV
jgi:eukaryotic-like serine/threonine-protein kinase